MLKSLKKILLKQTNFSDHEKSLNYELSLLCGIMLEAASVDGKIDQGLTDIPALSIRTNTGFGAKILPVTRFVKREEYTDPVVPDAQLVRVISCPRFY